MDFIYLYALALIFVSAAFLLKQDFCTLVKFDTEGFSAKTERDFYQAMLKLAIFFLGTTSFLNRVDFFKSNAFEKMPKRLQIVSVCLWNLSFVVVPLFLLTFLQLNVIHLLIGMILVWLMLKGMQVLFCRKQSAWSIGEGWLAVVLALAFSDQILRGLTTHFMSDDPSAIFLLAGQRSGLAVGVFGLAGLIFSFILHSVLRPVLTMTWFMPLLCLYLVAGYLISLPVALVLVAMDRLVLVYVMFQQIRSTTSTLRTSEQKQYGVVAASAVMFFLILSFFVVGLFSGEPSPQWRVFLYSTLLISMQMIVFVATMVWGHFVAQRKD